MTPATATPELLVLGHVTRDEIEGDQRLGGAASYAALAAARLGVRTALVTVAPGDDPLLASLRGVPGLEVRCAPSEAMTTFSVNYVGTREGSRAPRDGLGRAEPVLPHAVNYVGTREGSRAPRDGLGRAEPVLPHAVNYVGTREGSRAPRDGLGRAEPVLPHASYAAEGRKLVLRGRARALSVADVPAAWLRAPVAYVGPVAAECDRALLAALRARFVGAGLQGWLRRAGAGGVVEAALLPEAAAPPPLQVAVVSELDHPEVERIALLFAAAGATVAITRAARGATLLTSRQRLEIPAAPAREVDPTGAGDVFGVVLTLRLAAGASLADAGAAAAQAAARVVEGPGLGRLAIAADHLSRSGEVID